jgi:diaminopimelate decarboxylase
MNKTPYFVINKEKLDANADGFAAALAEHWHYSSIAYSIKTNSLPWLLRYMKEKSFKVEAVSDEEYELAILAGFEPRNVVFNGPIKSKRLLRKAVEAGSYVNIDSQSDVDCLLSMPSYRTETIGVRINVNTAIFEDRDVGYVEDGFRFGFSEENGELLKLLKRLNLTDCRFGLHLHCNSVTRNVTVYTAIAKYAAELIKKYRLNPSFIDMGGGFAGGIEGKPTPTEYITAIKNQLCDVIDVNDTELIIEPGSAIIGSAVELHTSVLDVKQTAYSNIITTDGSRIYLDPLWRKSRYSYEIKFKKDPTKREEKQIICGYTCMDHDRIMCLENEYSLSVGDQIVYMREGAYSMTLGGLFIKYLCDVYVRDGEKMTKVRNKMSAKKYYRLQS